MIDPLYNFTHVNAEVTKACNLSCNYCFNNSGQPLQTELSIDQWKQIINIAKEYGAESALFTGGEVMTRKDSPEIVLHALEQNLKTSILSNGLRLNKQHKAMIQGLERVQISLDSASSYSHDTNRGNGSWRVARKAIDYVRELGVPVEISTTVSYENLNELEGIAGIAYLTESKVLIRPMQSLGRAVLEIERPGLKDVIEEIKQKLEDRLGNIFVEDYAHYVPMLGQNHDKKMIPQGFITILPDGNIRGTKQNILELKQAA
jgi:MoaA/NifB/PqqE/SkfB family radical SAM enzyme